LLTQVVQACQEYSSRLDKLQACQVRILAKEAQLDQPLVHNEDPSDGLAAQASNETSFRIAIYSLDESSTRRAVEILKSLHPYWTIDINSDKVCTDRLKSLAHKANVFIFAWRCSKHSAYFCVKANSRKECLVMAQGVGTSSLVATAVDYITKLES
jgi:hypothetical protein